MSRHPGCRARLSSAVGYLSPSSLYPRPCPPPLARVYFYTANQTSDPAADSWPAPNPADRAGTEHVFQLGNSRITLVASNYGSWRLRQDEGGPKWLLGASDVAAGTADDAGGTQYGAGFGYLREQPRARGDGNSGEGEGTGRAGEIVLGTYYTAAGGREGAGSEPTRTREFGVGYTRSTVEAAGWKVAHTTAVAPGDDPVAVVEIRLTNTEKGRRAAVWNEVVGGRMVHMDYFATLALSHLDPFYAPLANRHEFSARHYTDAFKELGGNLGGSRAASGLQLHRTFTGLTELDRQYFDRIAKGELPTAANASFWDHSPPDTFAVTLGGKNDERASDSSTGPTRFGTDAKAFFGDGGVRTPAGSVRFEAAVDERHAAMLTETPIDVAGGDTVTICLLVGYLPVNASQFTVGGLAGKYGGACSGASGAVANIAGQWKGKLATLEVEAAPSMGPELAWHSFYLQSGVSYDDCKNHTSQRLFLPQQLLAAGLLSPSQAPPAEALWLGPFVTTRRPCALSHRSHRSHRFRSLARPRLLLALADFGEHILDQGMSYRYSIGFQGAARDPVQHALGLLHTDPSIAKSVLRCTLKQMQTTLGIDPLRPTDLPYAMSGHGVKLAGLGLDLPIFGSVGKGNHPSDMELYVLLLAAEYMLVTRDVAVLDERVEFYNSTESHTVLEALVAMARFSIRTVGIGPHGLMRMLTSDWDDGLGPPDTALNVYAKTCCCCGCCRRCEPCDLSWRPLRVGRCCFGRARHSHRAVSSAAANASTHPPHPPPTLLLV